MTHYREQFEQELKRHNTSVKKIEDASKRYSKHMANANKLAKRCVDDLKACGIQSPTLQFSEQQAKKWLDEVDILKKKHKDNIVPEGGRETLRLQIKDLKKAQAEVLKDILAQIARIAGASVVMPCLRAVGSARRFENNEPCAGGTHGSHRVGRKDT